MINLHWHWSPAGFLVMHCPAFAGSSPPDSEHETICAPIASGQFMSLLLST
jgi:hypothetical protein